MSTNRSSLDLAGPWRFNPDPLDFGESLGFWQQDYDTASWLAVSVPSTFAAACPNLEFYEGVCWYRLELSVPSEWQGKRIVLHFESVCYRAKVWINGRVLGENRDGCLPFEFDLHDMVDVGGENNIAVRVDNRHHEGDVPGMHTGWRRFGGILGEVQLTATDPCHVSAVRIVAIPEGEGGDLRLNIVVQNTGVRELLVGLAVTVLDDRSISIAELSHAPRMVSAGAEETFDLADTLGTVDPWSPTVPTLYRAAVLLTADDVQIDETEVTFGFRRIEATPEGLLLNGKQIYLRGFNRHEDSPHRGMAADHETTRQDLVDMKEAGANFVRLCHYPHNPKTASMCDEIGLLVFAEVPLYFWNDYEEGRRTNAARVETAAGQLERLVERDFNHPSIIFWSVSNETHENEEAVWKSNEELIRGVRALDPTRLAVHVSNHWRDHPHFAEDDVVCVNGYPGIDHAASAPGATADFTKAAEAWRDGLAALQRKFPGKPILITEFGYVSLAGTNDNAYGEEVHARALVAEFSAFDAPYICGATIWCWADHAWPNVRFLGGLTVSPYGVVTRDRRKLKPYWTARKLFSQTPIV